MIEIFYDVTRIIERSNSPTPTGIDRVDIKYANHFRSSNKYNANFVFTFKGIFYLCSDSFSEYLIKKVYGKWIENAGHTKDFPLIGDVVKKHIPPASE